MFRSLGYNIHTHQDVKTHKATAVGSTTVDGTIFAARCDCRLTEHWLCLAT